MPRKYTPSDLLALSSDMSAPLPAPKRRKNEESEMQRALIRWWRDNCAKFGVHEWLLFSVPNGGNWDAKRGSIMRAEGQRKGAPDLLLMAARTERMKPIMPRPPQDYNALCLELKTRTGIVSPEQETFHEQLRRQGYKVAVVRSLPDAINTITAYLT